jgi:hypothetical protein
MGSIGEAAENACLDIEDIDLNESGGLAFQGMAITSMTVTWEKTCYVLRVKPAPAMFLFIGWLMANLPSSATLSWRNGWPHVYCPPNDDADFEDDPTPLVPNELVPA